MRGYLEALTRGGGHADRRLLAAAQASGDALQALVETLAAYRATDRPAERRAVSLSTNVAAAPECSPTI